MRRYIKNSPEKKTSGTHSKETILEGQNNRRKVRKVKHIKLISKRSLRVEIYGPCSFCSFKTNPLWYYSKSTVGPVYLCVSCKTKKIMKKESKSNLSRKDEEQMKKNLFYKNKIKLSGQIDSNRQRH